MILFWLGVIFILAFVCIIFYQTLKKNNTQFDENADLNFYKSQLSEIEKDVAKGVINSEEAEQVRIEISRRILKNQKSFYTYFWCFCDFSFLRPLFGPWKSWIF